MRTASFCAVLLLSVSVGVLAADAVPVNPAIDMPGFLRMAQVTARHRANRRLSVTDFARLSREPGTIVLDARSREKYEQLHIKGAINLSFSDIDVASLARILPDRTRAS